ncbi:MAG TPA: hypothetical protein VE907_08330 [Gammaproteobacteria bacterium]|nr:hypothetical protein [Gammaproteobacteria bacterium]
MALLLAQTLRTVALKDPSPRAKERYLERARAAYRDVVKTEPFNASGYLGLAELAETGEQRVEWLRGAVRAEYRPADMERLADALAKDIGGHTGDLESALVLEDAYTLEATAAEKWRYAALAWQRYGDAADRYPLAASERTLQNVVTRLKADIDYPVLQRILLEPASHLPYLADAFATLCEKSIAAIVTLDECMAGLELAVATAEGSSDPGTRRWIAEAVLRGMRTIAGEVPPRSAEHQLKFLRWIDRLVATRLSPVDVEADLLEARADFTEDLFERAQALLSAIELCPNRSDLRLKLGATYVNLQLWFEALEQLRVADYLVLPEEHEEHARVAKLLETANKAYDARFLPPDVPATPATGR